MYFDLLGFICYIYFSRSQKRKKKSINLAIVSDNNHYAGFGPGTANIFRNMVGSPEVVWSKEENKKEEDHKSHLHSSNSGNVQQHHNLSQSTLSDFMT